MRKAMRSPSDRSTCRQFEVFNYSSLKCIKYAYGWEITTNHAINREKFLRCDF